MPNLYEFYWKAKNRFNQKQFGKLLATGREEVEQALLKQGFKEIKISRNFHFPTKPKQEEITQLLSQLTLLLNAKINLKNSLNIILSNTIKIKLYQWISHIIYFIETGLSFSQAIEKSETYLQPQEIQLIKIAELSGNLPIVLKNITLSREKSEKLLKKIKKIMFYPIILLAIAASLSILMLIFIVPKFAELYQNKDKSLPLLTEILFSISHLLQDNYASILITLFFCSFIIIILSRKTILIRRFKFWLIAHLPIFKTINHYARIIFFCQYLSLMLHSHIRLELALSSFLNEKNNDTILQSEIKIILSQLRQGYRFSKSLNQTIFSQQAIQMIDIGERSGQLAMMLEYIADNYQQKLDYQIDILSQLLEPLLMLLMGTIVGTILIGLYLPIFDMGSIIV